MTQAKHGISALALLRRIVVICNTAWKMHHKLRRVMLEREAARLLRDGYTHVVDADLQAYFKWRFNLDKDIERLRRVAAVTAPRSYRSITAVQTAAEMVG